MRQFFTTWTLCVLMVLFASKTSAQCISPTPFGGATITACPVGTANINTCTFGGEYNPLTFSITGTFVFNGTGGTGNYLTFTDAANTPIAWGFPPLTVTVSTTGNYRLHVSTNASCGTESACHTTSYWCSFPLDMSAKSLPNPVNGCFGANQTVAVEIVNSGNQPIDFAVNNTTVSSSVSGVNPMTFPQVVLTTGTLMPMATQTVVMSTTYNMTAVGGYTFSAFTNVTGDQNTANDNMPTNVKSVTAPVGLSQSVNFTGYTGANLTTVFPNWKEAMGVNTPTGTTSNWLSQTGLNGTGNITARVQLFGATRNEWIVGPRFMASANSNLTFDAAVTEASNITLPDMMGSDDMVRVMVSTDCGASFTPIYTVSATNNLGMSFTNFSVSLASYAGQEIIVAFYATDGPVDDIESYDFHLDNINLFNSIPSDAGLTALISPVPGCYGSTETVAVTIKNYGTGAITNIPVTVIVSGAVSQTFTATYTNSIPSGATDNFTVGILNMTTNGTYNFNGSTALGGDMNTFNDAMATASRTQAPVVALSQQVNFTGFTGANLTTVFPNWREAIGTTTPTGTTANWLSQTGVNQTGNITARVQLFGNTRNEWIVGPKFLATATTTLSFDAAITEASNITLPDVMGSDDKVRVMVSTDCGITFTPIYTITAANNLGLTFTNFLLPLASYAGQNIIIAFHATDGPIDDIESYDFHLDNINIYNGFPADAGLTAMVSPSTNCVGASENIVVTIKNYGTAPITNVPVTVIVSGAATATLTGTYTGVIPAGATDNFTVGVLNMSANGTYNFTGSTNLGGDTNTPNNTMPTTSRTVTPLVTLAQQVNFNGFTGANLTTVFPNWKEAMGMTAPFGTTANWFSATNLNGAGNITARVQLFGNTRNEWIVGPKFTATAGSMLTFDAAVTEAANITLSDVMGSDDKVRVMISTDCGMTYSPILTINATNSLSTTFTNFSVPLNTYAGQDVIIAFHATDGPVDDIESYDFHLDNINLYNMAPIDAGLTVLAQPTVGCYGANENVVVTIKNYGLNTLTTVPVEVVVSGAANQTFTPTYTGSIASNATVNFTVGTLNMTAPGVYTFKGWTNLGGDGNQINDTMAVANRTAIATVTLNQAVNFNGYTGANLTTVFPNWREGQGATGPNGTFSNWLNQTGINTSGNTSARVNLWTTSANEWIVGPKFTATANSILSFDAAVTAWTTLNTPINMGSDDKVRVMVSTNCGVSFTPIYTVSATNSLAVTFTNFTVSLGAYAGQDIMVAFLAQDGPVDDAEDLDFHLDNINLYNAAPNDAGISAVTSPSTSGCYTSSEIVAVDITNYGIAPISNIPVSVFVSGPTTATLTGTYVPTLAVGATANFTVGTVNMSFGGVYTFSATTALGGDPNTFNDVTITTRTVSPVISITGNTNLCLGSTTTLSINGAAVSYTWDSGATTSSIVVTPTATTVYTVTGTAANSCTSIVMSTVTVTNPTIVATGAQGCGSPATATLTASAFGPISWYASSSSTVVLATGNSYVPPPATVTTTYYVEANSVSQDSLFTTLLAGNGQSGNMFDVVAINSIDVNSVDMHFSSVGTATVEIWYRPGSFVGFENANTGWTLAHTATVMTNGTGSLTKIPGTFTVNVPAGQTYGFYAHAMAGGPQVNYTNGTSLGAVYAQNSDLQILEGKGGSYFGVTFTPRVWNGQLHYKKVGCTSAKIPVTLTITPNPTVTATASSATLCSGSQATLTASGAPTYSWSNGANTATTIVTPTASTTYTVDGYDGICTGSTVVSVSVSPSPTVNAVSSSSAICSGNSASLTASGAVTYTWSTGSNNATITESPTVSTTYTVIGECANGCTSSATVGILVNPTPTVNAAASSSSFCSGGSTTLTASGANTYTWSTNATGPMIVVSPTLNTVYTVYGSDGVCTGSTLVSITVLPAPPVNATSNTSVICAGNFVNLSATGALSFTWSTGATNASTSHNPSASTVYTVTGSGSNGCTASATVGVNVNPTPTVTTASSATLLCVGETVTITASGANTYTWSNSTTGFIIVVSPTVTTSYTVTGTSSDGCTDNDVFTQIVDPCVGIKNISAGIFGTDVFPNPNNGIFSVVISTLSDNPVLEIYDAVGRQVMTKTLTENETRINMSGYANGVYNYKIKTDFTELKRGKLIKQ